jgi:DnaJ-class molecular chaperone
MESQPKTTVIRDVCEYCDGRGYVTEYYPQYDSTDARSHSLSYTCTHCGGSGKGDIKGFIG